MAISILRSRLDSCLRTQHQTSGQKGSSRGGAGLNSHMSQMMGSSIKPLLAPVCLGLKCGMGQETSRQVKMHFKAREPFPLSRLYQPCPGQGAQVLGLMDSAKSLGGQKRV